MMMNSGRAGRTNPSLNKRLLIAGIAVVVLGCSGAVFWFLRHAPERAADAFLQVLGQGRLDEAYLSTARSFQQSTSAQQFSHIVRRTGLDRAVSSSWAQREVSDNLAALQGEFQMGDGKGLPIAVALGKDGDMWKVQGFQVQGTVGPPELPAPTEVVQIADHVMRDFAVAVQARDFSDLYQGIATAWQREVTPADFAASFKDFINDELDLTRIVDVPLTLEPKPSIDRDRALDVQGFYPTTPSRVFFHMRLVDESGAWRLVSLTVRLDPITAPAPVAPQHR